MAWIDYQKAFDSVPHTWILETLAMSKVAPVIRRYIEHVMTKWQTILQIQTKEGTIKTNPISIKRGIFQGDSLSPLLFCLALTPLTDMLIVIIMFIFYFYTNICKPPLSPSL